MDNQRMNELWDEYSQLLVCKCMYMNFYINSFLDYVEREIFNEFKFKKRFKENVISNVRSDLYEIFDNESDVSIRMLCNIVINTIKSECEKVHMSKSKFESIMTKLTDSMEMDKEIEEFLRSCVILSTIISLIESDSIDYNNELYVEVLDVYNKVRETLSNRLCYK